MHRVRPDVRADWQAIDESKWNIWQRVANTSYGLLTIGNVITLFGTTLVFLGIARFMSDEYLAGTILIGTGRLADYYDGILADMTQTKSLVGATMDEVADTIQLAFVLVVLTDYDVLPLVAALAIGIPKFLNALSWVGAKIRRLRSKPTSQSKLGTFFLWGGISLFMLDTAVSSGTTAIDIGGWLMMAVAVLLTVPSTILYVRVGIFGMNKPAID